MTWPEHRFLQPGRHLTIDPRLDDEQRERFIQTRLIALARTYGWQDTLDDQNRPRPDHRDDPLAEHLLRSEQLYDRADEATAYLETLTPPGYCFGLIDEHHYGVYRTDADDGNEHDGDEDA